MIRTGEVGDGVHVHGLCSGGNECSGNAAQRRASGFQQPPSRRGGGSGRDPASRLGSDCPVGVPARTSTHGARNPDDGSGADQPFEWSRHELEAVAVGLNPAVIDIVRHPKPLAGLGDQETAIIQIGREMFGTHRLHSETCARALKVFGKRDLSLSTLPSS
jgi:hypothetical protein